MDKYSIRNEQKKNLLTVGSKTFLSHRFTSSPRSTLQRIYFEQESN